MRLRLSVALRAATRRLLIGLVTIWVVATVIFGATEILPGDVAEAVLGPDATPESLAAMRERLGLDRPVLLRYATWLDHALLRLDLGASLGSGRPVAEAVGDRLWNTARLAAVTALLAIPAALALGVISAIRAGSVLDRGIGLAALCAVSVPGFFVAIALVYVFAVQLGWLPALATVRPGQTFPAFLRSVALPSATLAIGLMPHIIRQTRNALLAALSHAHIEMAVLKGVPRSAIILRHALPNALAPILNIVALVSAYLVAGVVVVETVFGFPGLGRLMVDAVATRDTPVAQACALIFATTYVVANALADTLAVLANPRLRVPR
ncbi:ABC transporter permease [Dongia sedimenti]|uniref:ABC transporter permease n=1 Tax=Dongia sedimenti TaxID=3064282 RepID=A0ABU0YPI1_9PROT|nr:ABC transporter permease [Rhodospirillaceae bacterium R-7]